MIALSRFNEADFERFKSWIPNQEELIQFAGPIFTFPLSDQQLSIYAHDPRRIPYKIQLSSNEVIGHCELNFENPLPRLSRILIADKNRRGIGLGKLVVNKMLEKLFIERDFKSADLNVFDWNIGAIKCYESVGFAINKNLQKTQDYNGKLWTSLNMVITKEEWLGNLR